MLDSVGKNTSALVEVDLESMKRKVIHESPKADIDDYIVDVKTKMVQASAINYMRKEWTIVDESIRSDLDYLMKLEDGDVEIVSRSAEDDKWMVVYLKSDGPYRYYLYDRRYSKQEPQ